MDVRRVQVRAHVMTRGVSPALVWELLRRTTIDARATVTCAMAPYFLDTELHAAKPGALPSGMRRDVEQVDDGVRVTLTRWVDCPPYAVTPLAGHHTDQLAELVRSFCRAVGAARSHVVSR